MLSNILLDDAIVLTLEKGIDIYGRGHIEPALLTVEADSDSYFAPSNWVWLSFATENEPAFRLTYSEASELHYRLEHILGISGNTHDLTNNRSDTAGTGIQK